MNKKTETLICEKKKIHQQNHNEPIKGVCAINKELKNIKRWATSLTLNKYNYSHYMPGHPCRGLNPHAKDLETLMPVNP